MKNLFFSACSAILFASSISAQASGNVNHATPNSAGNVSRYGNPNPHTHTPHDPSAMQLSFNQREVVGSVRCMANLKADSYVAILSVSQTGKTTEETNKLIDERIGKVKKAFANKPKMECVVDMISFIPMYEMEAEKKVFSRTTYNEIPKGFEVKKNLHIKFDNVDALNDIIAICAEAEIYDLVRVDYYSTKMDETKIALKTRASALIKEKLKGYADFLEMDFSLYNKQIAEGYKVFYPVEMYQSYQAYSSNSLNLRNNQGKTGAVTYADKTTTYYYQPVVNRDFDFVINHEIVEPTIQIVYEIRLRVDFNSPRPKDAATPTPTPAPVAKEKEIVKQFYLVTPNGDVRLLDTK